VSDDRSNEDAVLDAWRANATPWVDAVRRDGIASRVEVTNAAMLDAIERISPASVLDVGCGEGWLTRALHGRGIQAMGIDAVPELIEAARREGGPGYRVLSYEALAAGELPGPFDAVVCNFSLIGKAGTEAVVEAAAALLRPGGWLVVQTLHPAVARGDAPYADGWREGSWDGCGSAFAEPAPWYFRTFGGWLRLLEGGGFRLREIREPIRPGAGEPVSALFLAQLEAA
jgi:2-polyprenyl-3-methyl-5-hydroxy-6-metoxy-1,4-benzoquinol methylase